MSDSMTDAASLKRQLVTLFGHLQKIRKELAALTVSDDQGHFTSMSEQLDAIVEATESATNTIMEECEGIEGQIQVARGRTADKDLNDAYNNVSDRVNRIFEACAFQDITGQRVTKVLNSMKFVEERVNAIILTWGQDELTKVVDEIKSEFAEKDPDKKLLHGPALPGHGVDQKQVDKILEQSEIDKLFG